MPKTKPGVGAMTARLLKLTSNVAAWLIVALYYHKHRNLLAPTREPYRIRDLPRWRRRENKVAMRKLISLSMREHMRVHINDVLRGMG